MQSESIAENFRHWHYSNAWEPEVVENSKKVQKNP